MVVVGALMLWFALAISLADVPAFLPGTEVRVVSPDLLTVYASGRVEEGRLSIELPLGAGSEVRLLVFQPDASGQAIAEALTGGAALHGVVSDDRDDILVRIDDLPQPLSLRIHLLERHGVELVLITRRSP